MDNDIQVSEFECDADVPQINDKLFKSVSVFAHPNSWQKLVLSRWFDAYILMFNETIKYIKNQFDQTKLRTLREMNLKGAKLGKQVKEANNLVKTLEKDKTKIQKSLVKLKTKKKVKTCKKVKPMEDKKTKKVKPKDKNKQDNKNKILELEEQLKNLKAELSEKKRELHLITMKHSKAKKLFYKSHNEIKSSINYHDLRTYKLKGTRDTIKANSQIKYDKRSMVIHTHMLDTAIKRACAIFKTCFTNFIEGNIKRFRVNYWKLDRKNKILEIEKETITGNTIAPKILGKMKYSYNNQEYQLEPNTVFLRYNSDTNQYIVDIPKVIEQKPTNENKRTVSLDPGIRTFMTGISNNEVMKFGSNIFERIKSYIKRINISKEIVTNENRKKGIEKKYNRKIKNLVNDMQWKIANILSKNYKTVLIGDMSSKDICSKKNKVLDGITKQAVMQMNFYTFRKRLEYKCTINKTEYKEIDERYTSKMCLKCGSYNEKLGGNDIFHCKECQIQLDRDVNACRNILIKGLK